MLETAQGSLPKVSILIAVRNEAYNIELCLRSIHAQNYPNHLLEVWIGDDASSDETPLLISNFIADKPHFNLLHINEQWPGLKGKANVLAQLATKATGSVLFITDGDMELPPDWITEMLKGLQKADMVNGVTTNKFNNVFEAFQAIDWLVALGYFTLLNRCGISYTLMGNNMCISRRAYEATGGYENIPFSVTEDYALYKAAAQKGFTLKHLYHTGVIAYTKPQPDIAAWMQQRMRWLCGALDLPWYGIMPFYAHLSWYVALAISLIFSGISVISIFFLIGTAAKLVLNGWFLVSLKKYKLLPYLPIFELLWPILYSMVLVRYSQSPSIIWKARTFEKA